MTFAATASFAQGPTRDESSTKRKSSAQGASEDKKDFVQKLSLANFAEVQLGKLGVQHASSPDVKSFAQMMVTDHSKSNQELAPFAKELGVQPVTELDAKHKAVADRLSKLQGAEFDKEFMKAMVDAHREAVTDIAPMAGVRSADGGGSIDAGSTSTPVDTSASAAHPNGSGASASGGSTSGTSGSSTAGSTSHSVGTTGASSHTGTTAGSASTVEQFATKTLAAVNTHLKQAQQLESRLDK